MEKLLEHPKQVPLNDHHLSLGAKMIPFAGYNMPVRYSSDIEEHLCVRQKVGIFDVSHMGEFVVRGRQALELIQLVSSNDASKLTNGKVQYSCLPNTSGGIVDDLLVYKVAEEEYFLVVNASNIDKDWDWINQYNSFDATLENVSDQLCLFAVQGPNALPLLQKLTDTNIALLPYYSFTTTTVAGIADVLLSNTGYTGAGGFELYVQNAHAASLWDSILSAGKEFDIKPIGLGARDTLRLEMGYCLYGNDIDDTTSPLEAGLGWITSFSKKFINHEALKIQKEQGVSKKLIGFELVDRGIPRSHYEITDVSGRIIGSVTSGAQSPLLGKGIGMGYVKKEFATPGSEIFISIRNKSLKAKVIKLPFINQ